MKKPFCRIYSYVFAAIFLASISSAFALENPGDVVDGRIVNVSDPIKPKDGANKRYVDDEIDRIEKFPAILQTIGGSETAVMSQAAVTNALADVVNKQEICDIIYPVDSVYISLNSANPQALFGGIWELIENRFLLGAGSLYTAGNEGGNASISLAAANIPGHTHSFSATSSTIADHTHGFSATTSTGGSHSHEIEWDHDGERGPTVFTVNNPAYPRPADNGTVSTHDAGNHNHTLSGTTNSGGTHSHTVGGTTGSTGSGTSFNIMPPYLVVYLWQRIA